jgi:DNA processing protein
VADERGSLLPWLRLSLTPGLNGAGFRRLCSAFGSPAAVLAQPARVLASVVQPALASAILNDSQAIGVERALQWAGGRGRHILTLEDPHYPGLLLETPDPPPVLYAAGRLELLDRTAVAVVGSRNATAQGMRNAEAFAGTLSAHGICVVSGMALGIDGAAHEASLGESGSTIAVLGNGIDVTYPRRNAPLFERIVAIGLALSEFPLGTPPLPAHFPRRNRIISGISRGCLVVEAAIASGSLITARLAADMGRDVFAIPGSIHSPLSRGCHHLIKQGAKLVETASDVLEELGVAVNHREPIDARSELAADLKRVLSALGHDPCDLDTLAARTRLPLEQLLAALTQLELDARLSRDANGSYVRLD